MITENDVVKAVAAHLGAHGYRVDQALSTAERGIDVIARHRTTGERLLVEAKGGTSSKEGTARFGKPFNRNQAKSHVSVALYYATKLRDQHADEGAQVALALPDDANHRRLIEDISSSLRLLGIVVFFVDGRHTVTRFADHSHTVARPAGS